MRHHELDYRVKLRSCHDTHVYNLFLRTRLVVGENFNVISLRQFCHLVIQNFCRGVLIAGKTVGAGQFSKQAGVCSPAFRYIGIHRQAA